MIELVNTARSISSQDPLTGIASSPNAENDNITKNNSSGELNDFKEKKTSAEDVKKLSKEVVERTVQALKDYIESNKRSLDISVYEKTGDIIIKVISEKDGKVIREMPPEKLLDLAARMQELAGSLFNEIA